MHTYCGLDFGTSNSTIGVCPKTTCELVPLEGEKTTLRSAIFCDAESKQWVFGQEGIDLYLDSAPGRLMMALKSVLGSSLMDDKTLIFNEYIPYAQVLGQFIHHLKTTAENRLGNEITQVVLGRPVHFHDNDTEKDQLAQNTLEAIATDLGFKDISFQYEPIAAALTYETTIQKEQLALIIDMGGGTSDFTLIRLHPKQHSADRSNDVLANCGIHIAGTDFDKKLSLHSVMPLLGMGSLIRGSSSDVEMPSMYYHDLTTWHTLANLYDAKTLAHMRSLQNVSYQKDLMERLIQVIKYRAGHHILDCIETSKQRLSDIIETNVDLSFIEEDLSVLIQRTTLNDVLTEPLQKIIHSVVDTVKLAGCHFEDVQAIFYTGGSTKIPLIRQQISALFTNATVIQGDAFGSVGLGLTLDAQRKYS